jgi:hypothetical protein
MLNVQVFNLLCTLNTCEQSVSRAHRVPRALEVRVFSGVPSCDPPPFCVRGCGQAPTAVSAGQAAAAWFAGGCPTLPATGKRRSGARKTSMAMIFRNLWLLWLAMGAALCLPVNVVSRATAALRPPPPRKRYPNQSVTRTTQSLSRVSHLAQPSSD